MDTIFTADTAEYRGFTISRREITLGSGRTYWQHTITASPKGINLREGHDNLGYITGIIDKALQTAEDEAAYWAAVEADEAARPRTVTYHGDGRYSDNRGHEWETEW